MLIIVIDAVYQQTHRKKEVPFFFLPARPYDTYFTCSKHELPVEYSRRICFGNNIAESKYLRPLLTLSVTFTCVSFHP